MKKVYVFGSIIMDNTTTCHHVPRDGESVFGNEYYVSYGGKGINQAMMIKNLDGDVTMIGAIGKDSNGQSFEDLLSSRGFDLTKIFKKDNISTGISNIIIDCNGQNRIIVVPGANYLLTSEDILSIQDEIKDDSVFLISNEIPIKTIKTIIDLGVKKKAFIILNPAPYKDLDDETLNQVDIITPNENEVSDLFKLDRYNEESVIKGFDKLKTKCLIVTLGDKGSLYYDHQNIKHYSPYKVEVVDTVGAGDAYNGGLTFGLANGIDMEDAIKLGTICASIAITRKGALKAQPDMEEVKEFYNKNN